MPNTKQVKVINEKQLHLWLILGVLFITLCVSWVKFSSYVTKLEDSTQGLSLVDYLNSSAQRLVKLELMGNPNDELIFNLDNIVGGLTPELGKESEYFGDHSTILTGISDVSIDWELTKVKLEEFREDGDNTALLSASERLFYHAAILTNEASDYITELSQIILRLQMLLMVQIAVIAIIIGYRLVLALLEVKRNRELSATMFIDTATGLFNRSKCHEVLSRKIQDNQKVRAMVVFDLNDLKKTNDVYGHRVGDELIYSFAQLINQATKLNQQEVFVGRYGGDEFMVYYSSTDENGIRLYLEEVAFLAEDFNEKETRFQISYAVGHAMYSEDKKDLTLRQLFDEADHAMYANKVAMKKRRAEEALQTQ